ncbi:MarR family transcriptional regulator [Pseudoxanthobacter sp.]|uniref:MarR family winged helix-turn-helix transcriptional regulator n=1 Tax=Pseudoxanthobacter sp. TaxID=1925742 RepID=UPI002FE05ED6
MSPSLTERERFGMLFVGVARRWRATLDAGLACLGLSDASWPPLVHIARSGGGLSQKDLAARIGIDGSSLVRLIDLLAARGLVERRHDAADRRANLLFLTPAGEAAVVDVQRTLSRIEGEMLSALGNADLKALVAALEAIDGRIAAMRQPGDGPSGNGPSGSGQS